MKTYQVWVSIPSRGFWFFEVLAILFGATTLLLAGFNPLAGILVF